MDGKYGELPDGVTKDSKLWRYMSLAKFHSMLSSKSLYFTRLDRLDDRLEAMLSPITVDAYVKALLANEDIQRILGDRPDGVELGQLQVGTADRIMRAMTFVNCWFLSDVESMAMWQNYGRDGVAIQTTWKQLWEVLEPFPDEITIAKVWYINFAEQANNFLIPWAYKDRIFSGEQEIRAAIKRPPRAASIIAVNRDQTSGVPVPVDLNRLIKKVYVAPGSQDWFKKVIHEMLTTYKLPQKQVITSGADHQPDYRRMYEEAREILIEKAYPLHPYEDEYPVDDPWGIKAAHAADVAAQAEARDD